MESTCEGLVSKGNVEADRGVGGADQNRTGDNGFADRSLSHLGTAPGWIQPAGVRTANAGPKNTAMRRLEAGDETRTRDIQLGKLAFYH